MELTSEFTVDAPIEQAWTVLTDVERVATCIPGAELQEVEGEEFRGTVKVKVGPITAQYKGTARFLEQDDAAHRVVIKAEGRETRGQGNASATITATLTEADGKTNASIVTDLSITGRVAQFGRGVLSDVSAKLLGQFATCLEADLRRGNEAAPTAVPTAADHAEASSATEQPSTDAASGPARTPARPPAPEAVNLMSVVGGSILKRVAAPLVSLAGLVGAFVFFRRRRRKSS